MRTRPEVTVASVGWDGRDVSGLSHEQIHRWTRDGASPEALAAARDRHLARADELRSAADRLQAAQRGVGETWVGRDADAAGARSRVLAGRMEQLARTVGGQARGIDGMRTALVRVQAAVGPPRPPALPTLGVTPVLDELRSLVTGRPADGYGGFRSAAADQTAAREAYRTYLGETATAARTVGPAGAGPPPAPGAAPAPPVGPGRTPLPVGARGAASGVLQRAAGPEAFPTAGAQAPGAGARPVGGLPVAGGRLAGGPGGVLAASGAGPAGGGPVGVAPGGVSAAGGPAGGSAGAPVGGPVGGGPVGGGVVGGSAGGPAGSSVGGGAVGGGAPGPSGVAAAPGPVVRGGPVPGLRAGGPVPTGGPVLAGGLPGGARPDVEPGPVRRPDERAPSVAGGPAGRPKVLDDHRGDFGPDAADAAEAAGVADPGGADPGDERAEEVVVPVRHVSWLVDPDPVGWGGGDRRVAPPVLGEGP